MLRLLTLLFSFTVTAIVLLFLSGCGSNNSTSVPTPPTNVPNAVTIYPGTASVSVNQTVQFKAFLPSAPTGTFTWTVSGGSANGAISASGVYTAPGTVPSPSSVTVTATDAANTALTGVVTINIAAAQGVTVNPAALAMAAGAVQNFAATVNGSAVTAQWSVNGIAGGNSIYGTVDSSGNYTAPLTPPPGAATTITAASGSSSGSASVTVIFSTNSINGPYAFSYTGDDGSGFLSAIGSFAAQGSSGTITGGVQDVLSFATGATRTPKTFTGNFSVNPDGGATITFSTGTILQLTLVANQLGRPVQQVPLVRFDTGGTGSGTLNAQNAASFTASALAGNYVFGVSGLDAKGVAIAIAGRFFADGVGSFPVNQAEEDINYAGTNTFAAADTSVVGSFSFDSTFGGSNGLGTITLTSTDSTVLVNTSTTFTFAFFMVDNTHIKLLEIDNNFAMSGDVYSGAATANIGSFTTNTALPAGKYSFALGGVSNNGPYAIGGAMSASSGTLSGVMDVNNGGSLHSDANAQGAYTTDNGFGRITVPLTISGTTGLGTTTLTIDLAGYRGAYLGPSGQTVQVIEMIELDTNQIASGVAYPQTTSPSLAGNYAMNLSGIANVHGNAVEEDVIGQLTASSAAFSGTLNINNFARATTSPNVPLTTGTAIVSPDTNGRGTMTLKTNLSNDSNFSIVYYDADNGILLLDTDGSRVATGVLNKQF